jgi:hypothetical protein
MSSAQTIDSIQVKLRKEAVWHVRYAKSMRSAGDYDEALRSEGMAYGLLKAIEICDLVLGRERVEA